MSTTPTPVEIGTLIVVILKARNLPNKRHLGKQAPYCTVIFNGETRRTKVIKRGGQHPEWDEEVRFTLFEDDTPVEEGYAPPVPPKDGKIRKVKGGEKMRLSCFADDPREPDLIGETEVDLTEVLTKGETDEWFVLNHRDRYCGEVYLELTFWSNAPPPQKKQAPVSQKIKQEYGGTGEFTPLHDDPPPSDDFGRLDAYMETIRPSNSSSRVPLYMPSYEARGIKASSVDQFVNDFGELGVGGHGGRSSTYPPPLPNDYPGTVGSTISYPPPDHGSSLSANSDVPGHGQRVHRLSDSSTRPYIPYQAPYEQGPPASSSFSHQPTTRRPRYSMPVQSSGFMPVPSASEPSGFAQHGIPSQMADGNGISLPPSRMSVASYAPPPTQTPAPHRGPRHSFTTPVPSSSYSYMSPGPSAGHLSYAPSLHAPAPQHPAHIHPPASAPPVQQIPPAPPSTLPPVTHSAPPQSFPNGLQQHIIPPHVPGSRPLPQPAGATGPTAPLVPPPQGYYSGAVEAGQYALPTPPGPPGPLVPGMVYDRIPPPPPLPTNSSTSSLSTPSTLPHQPMQRSASGRPSLPMPPGPPSQPSAYQSLPQPPPPPPLPLRRSSSSIQLPSAASQVFGNGQPVYPGPPPRPPAQMIVPAGQYVPAPPVAPNQYNHGGY